MFIAGRRQDELDKAAAEIGQKALPYLDDGASIILVASAGKNKGFPGRGTYSASKAALRSFARTWTSELKDRQIRTNVLSPGAVDTPMFDAQFPSRKGAAEARNQIAALTPLARLAYPDEIACAALFLASGLSSYGRHRPAGRRRPDGCLVRITPPKTLWQPLPIRPRSS